jgi:hypothetical protein
MRLQAEINWQQLFMALIQDIGLDALARGQTAALQAQGLPLPD